MLLILYLYPNKLELFTLGPSPSPFINFFCSSFGKYLAFLFILSKCLIFFSLWISFRIHCLTMSSISQNVPSLQFRFLEKKKRWKIINSKIYRSIFLCLTLEFKKCPLICNICRSVFIKGDVTAKKKFKSKLQNIVIFMANKFFMILIEIFTKSGIIGYFTSPQDLKWRHILWYLHSSKFWGRDNFLDFQTCLKRWI